MFRYKESLSQGQSMEVPMSAKRLKKDSMLLRQVPIQMSVILVLSLIWLLKDVYHVRTDILILKKVNTAEDVQGLLPQILLIRQSVFHMTKS